MSLLGCNAKMLWNELFNQIIDVTSTKKVKHGIIVCKYFHEIHSELLDIFILYKNFTVIASLFLLFLFF